MLDIEDNKKEFLKLLSDCTTDKKLKELEIKYLGRNGVVNDLLKEISQIEKDHKKEYGTKVNAFKKDIQKLINEKNDKLTNKKNYFDRSIPGKNYPRGSLHVISYAIEEISSIFEKIGFIRMSYPEVDWEYYVFESLNMPQNHPARDDFEASFIDFKENENLGKMVLTAHTSNGQNREMRRVGKPPIRMINISKCYRPNWDATHTPMFFQFEGLCIDSGINISHLKGTLDFFARKYFGNDTKIRLRPHHFQFTEPSFEVDISCTVCKGSCRISGEKCKVCKSGWLELGGTGMVHRNVLKEGGIDYEKYSGWAFGFGIERIIMMKYGIDDIRNYYNGDIRFLEQF